MDINIFLCLYLINNSMDGNQNEISDCYPAYTLHKYEHLLKLLQTMKIKKKKIIVTISDNRIILYTVLSYDKSIVCFDAPIELRQYRSVIYAEQGLISFSPPKSIEYNEFCKIPGNIYINEAIEGIMIHLFYDKCINLWQIATKSSDGATIEMVMDALHQKTNTNMNMNINDSPAIQRLFKNYSYTLVLQHPKNVILFPIQDPVLYVCAIYDINSDISRAIYIPPLVYEEWECFENSPFLFPRRYMNCDITSAKNYVESPQINNRCMGLMATNLTTGDRCKLINSEYLDMLSLRKFDTLNQYQYLCLYRIDRINEYLSFFPKHKKMYLHFSKQYNNSIKRLHESYILIYINKRPKSEISSKYTEYAERLHREIYLPSLHRGKEKCHITLDIVRNYMKKINPLEILHWLKGKGDLGPL